MSSAIQKLIELSFGMVSMVLDGRAHWRQLANMVERLCVEVINSQPELATQPIPKFPQIDATYDQNFVQVHDVDPSL